MLALWYNGISARVGRARAAQLYHIFGNLSIGKITKNFEQFLLLETLFQFVQVPFNFLASCVLKQEPQNLVVTSGSGNFLANNNLFHSINSFLLD